MQHGVGRNHVGATEANREGAAVDGLHLTAARGFDPFRQPVPIDDALLNPNLTLGRTKLDVAGVAIALHDQTANWLAIDLIGQLNHSILLAEDLGGGHHIAALHSNAVLHLEIGVGGAVAGIGEGVATHQQGFQNRQLQALNRLGPLIRNRFHIHRHLGSGVDGFQDQLGAQQLHTIDALDQLAVLKGQALGGLEIQRWAARLLNRAQFGQVGSIWDGVLLNRTQQQGPTVGSFN